MKNRKLMATIVAAVAVIALVATFVVADEKPATAAKSEQCSDACQTACAKTCTAEAKAACASACEAHAVKADAKQCEKACKEKCGNEKASTVKKTS